MKGLLRKIFLIFFAVVAVALPLIGCDGDTRAKYADELIPSADEMGEPEGLWLHKGEFRSRTDGSDTQRIFERVEIGGTEYASEQYEAVDYKYLHDAHKIIFLLEIDGYGYVLYQYKYKTAAGKYMCDAPSGGVNFTVSDGLIYARFSNAGYLFDADGDLLCDRICGTLNNGVLYNIYTSSTQNPDNGSITANIEWYNGSYHTAALPDSKTHSFSDVEIYGDYIYLSVHDEPLFAVNMNTESVTKFDIFDVEYDSSVYVDSYRNIQQRFYYDGCMYVFSVVYCIIDKGDETHAGKDEWYWYLHKIDGASATLECEFGEVRRGVDMGVYDGKFYFQARTLGNLYQKHYRYDPKTGELKKISRLKYHKGSIPHEYSGTGSTSADRRVKVGGYEFYVSSLMYGYSGFLTAPEGYCYYLNRKSGEKTEIMQYSFGGGYFYDDICEF